MVGPGSFNLALVASAPWTLAKTILGLHPNTEAGRRGTFAVNPGRLAEGFGFALCGS
jgi:hypothetical protein